MSNLGTPRTQGNELKEEPQTVPDKQQWFNEIMQNKIILQKGYTGTFKWTIQENRLDGKHLFGMKLAVFRNGNFIHLAQEGFTNKIDGTKFLIWLFYQYYMESLEAHMDSTADSSFAGAVNLIADKVSNTVMTRDSTLTTDTTLERTITGVRLLDLCTAEKTHTFPDLVDRWIPCGTGTFSTSDSRNRIIQYKHVYNDIYPYIDDSANSLAFKQFVFTNADTTIKIVPNSHKFAQGRYVLGLCYDAIGQGSLFDNVAATYDPTRIEMTLQRPHAMIDCNESNQAELVMPFIACENAVTTLATTSGSIDYDGGYYATAYVQCLSALRVPDSSPTTVPFTWFIKFGRNTDFIAMRRFIDPSAFRRTLEAHGAFGSKMLDLSKDIMSVGKSIPGVGGLFGGVADAFGKGVLGILRPFTPPKFIKELEKNLNYTGVIRNRDKPIDIRPPMTVLPNMTGDLACGVGGEFALSMRLNPSATTVLPEELDLPDTPEDILEILRRNTLRSGQLFGQSFTWTITDAPETLIYQTDAGPLHTLTPSTTSYGPFNLVTNFCFWSGSIEFIFDVIGTQYHTGQLAVAYIPFMLDTSFTTAKTCYIKYYDLREQKQFTFTLPYMNNTIKRSNNLLAIENKWALPNPGSICVYVINALTPIQSVSTSVEVIVMQRAGTDFKLEVPIYTYNYITNPKVSTLEDIASTLSTLDGVTRAQLSTEIPLEGHMEGELDGEEPMTIAPLPLPMTRPWLNKVKRMATHSSDIIDQTPSFGTVIPITDHVSHGEHHTDIKDLCRRTVVSHTLTFGDDNPQSVLVNPMSYSRSSGHLTNKLMRCFKFGRGSNVYMLRNTAQNIDAVDITHVPFTPRQGMANGPRYIGKGLATQTWYPKMNPVFKFEVPMYTPYNYFSHTTNMMGRASTQFTRNDYLRSTNGYLIVKPYGITVSASIDIWQRLGDDYQHLLFNGVPPEVIILPSSMSILRDKKMRKAELEAHMDGVEEEESPGFISGLIRSFRLSPAQVDSSAPDAEYLNEDSEEDIIPTPRVFSDFGRRTRDRVYNSFTSTARRVRTATNILDKVDHLTDIATSSIEKVRELASKAMDMIMQTVKVLTSPTQMFNALLHFFQACISRSWSSFVVAVTGMITSFGFFTLEISKKIFSFFSGIRMSTPSDQQTGEETLEAHCEHHCNHCPGRNCHPDCQNCNGSFLTNSVWATFGTLIFSGIAGYLGVAVGKSSGITAGLFNFTTAFWRTVSGAHRFMEDFVKLVKRCYARLMHSDPALREDATLAEDDEGLRHFISEASLITNQLNSEMITVSSQMKARFWMCVMSAYKYREIFSLRRTPESAAILRICDKVITCANNAAVHAKACPVRYEPFVLSVEGPTKIGKSYMLQHTIPELIRDVLKITTYDSPVFVRTPGVEYWNGYQNQPAILYDDFMASMDPTIASTQVIELFNLKSSAIMNMNMARIEEKELRGNPFIVALATNNAFAHPNGLTTPEAFLRRKDHSWKVSLKAEYKTLSEVTDACLKENDHLEFRRYLDPAQRNSLQSDPLSYSEWMKILETDLKKYHEIETKNVKTRLEVLRSLLPTAAQHMTEDADPFHVFYAMYTEAADNSPIQTGLLPSELLSVALDELSAERVEDESRPSTSLEAHWSNPYLTFKDWLREARERPVIPLLDDDAQCSICLDNIWTSGTQREFVLCANAHVTCHRCYMEMQRLQTDESPLRCGVCRDERMEVYDTSSTFVFLWRKIKTVAYNYKRKFSNILADVRFQRVIYMLWTGLMVYLYSSKLTRVFAPMVCAGRNLELVPQELTHENAYEWQIGKRLGFWFWKKKSFLLQDYAPFLGHAWGTFTNGGYHPPTAGNSYGQLMTRAILEAHAGDEYYWQLEDTDPNFGYLVISETVIEKVREFHDQYFGRVKLHHDAQIHEVITTPNAICPHHKLFKNYTLDITLSRNVDSQLMWNHELNYDLTLCADAPCQYDDCPFKDLVARRSFLIRWATDHRDYLENEAHARTLTSAYQMVVPFEFVAPVIVEEDNRRQRLLDSVLGVRKSFWERVKDKASNAWNALYDFVGLAGVVVGTIATLVAAYKCFKWFSGEPNNQPMEAHIINSGSMPTVRLPRSRLMPRSRTMLEAQNGNDGWSIQKVINRNTIWIAFELGRMMYARCFGVFGRQVLINAHYVKAMKLADLRMKKQKKFLTITVSYQSSGLNTVANTLRFDQLRFTDCTNDLYAFTLPPQFPQFKDIMSQVATLKQHAQVGNQVQLNIPDYHTKQMMIYNPTITERLADCTVETSEFYDQYELFDLYKLNIGRRGWCGSILTSNQNAPIFAFYVAGRVINSNVSVGAAVPLIRENLQLLKDNAFDPVTTYFQPHEKFELEAHFQLPGAVLPLAKVKPAYVPQNTKIIPSLIQGVGSFSPKTQPGILSVKDERWQWERSPLYHGCLKHTIPCGSLNPRIIDACVENLTQKIIRTTKPIRGLNENLTLNQSIVGLDIEYYDSINMKTSAGYPWNLGERKTKEEWFTIKRDEQGKIIEALCKPELLQVLTTKDTMRKRGIRPDTLFLDCLKDERRKDSKLSKPDGTRVFSLSPVDFTIATRQYFLDFSASYMTFRLDNEGAVGINPDGPEWTRLYDMLRKQSSLVITGDYSDFGPRLPAQIVEGAYEVINNWYATYGNSELELENANIRKMMKEEVMNADHVAHDLVYRTVSGIPSGHSLTSILNSICNSLLIRYAYFMIFGTLEGFDKNVTLVVYGDDLIATVSPSIYQQFNAATIGLAFKTFGLRFTDAQKTGKFVEETFQSATFLKRGFVKHPTRKGEWLAPIEQMSVTECAQWVWKSPDVREATITNAQSALLLAYGHGPRYFKTFRGTLNDALTRAGLAPVHRTWQELDMLYFDGGDEFDREYTACRWELESDA